VFHRVRHVGVGPVDTGLHKPAVQHPPGRTDEWNALPVLLITWLFADEHDSSGRIALAEDGLGGVLVQFAAPAVPRGGP
jgi:hypothetical protein